ncbi:MAG: DUF4838 domain-containing protein [Candidatus Omnitrophota bacterium]
MRALAGIFAVLFSYAASVGAETLDLSQMGGWTIVVADDALASEQYAAQEFQSLFKQAADIELPIAAQPPADARNVFIGPSEAMSRSSAAVSLDGLGEEDLRLRVTADNIVIAGGRPRGTLYGVYEFMERYLDGRFLTFDHTYFPAAKWRISWLIPCEEYTYKPPFAFRWPYYKENYDHHDFAARQRVNTTPSEDQYGGISNQSLISHTLYHFLPVEKYGAEHPEYFALVDGERKLKMGGGGPEVCVTNPDVIEIVAENVIHDLDANPNQKNISVSQNDNDDYCRCEKCEEITQREGTPMGPHLAFVNAVAERVEKKYPGVKIGTLAYWYTRKPPKTIQPRANVQIQLCSIECCTLYPIDDPGSKKNREFCQDMDDWSKICSDIWVWNYNTNFSFYDLPFPNLRAIGPNVKYFLKNNVKGLFMQANGNGNSGELCDLRNYVLSRCIWNPALDSWALAEEFCRLHYRGAAQPILDYLTMLHDNAEASGYEPNCFPRPVELGLRPEISEKAYDYFQKALTLADNESIRARVEKASICAYRAVLETCGQTVLEEGKIKVTYPEKFGNVIERYKELCQRHNMTMAAETMPAEEYFKTLDKAAKEGVEAVRLENSQWRLTFVPGRNGRMVEMIYKPAQRNLLFDVGRVGLARFTHEGTCQELGLKGYDHNQPSEFTAQAEENSLTLSKTLPDGSTLVRRMALSEEAPSKISCETTLTHNSDEPKVYQIKMRPEFDTDVLSDDCKVLSAYIKNDDWILFNEGWKNANGPQSDLLKNAKGGAYAFFNHAKGYGVLETYDAEKLSPSLLWNTGRPHANLELISGEVELKKGESLTLPYQFEYLDKPPFE